MKLHDIVWGDFEIYDPAILDILQNPSLLRLKEISQLGGPGEWTKLPDFSLYEHSVGVMLLLRKLGASLEEQIAGILHEESCTALSHIIDRVVGVSSKENFQDDNHEDYVKKRTNILDILKKYNIPSRCALYPDTYQLLEQRAPALCADRIDHSLRELKHSFVPIEIIEYLSHSLVRVGNSIVFSGYDSAKQFFDIYRFLQNEHWASDRQLGVQHILSSALKNLIAANEMTMEDFFLTDKDIIQKLRESKQDIVKYHLSLLDRGFDCVPDDKNYDVRAKKKFRYVNPAYLDGRNITTLSESVPEYEAFVKTGQERQNTAVTLRITPTNTFLNPQ